MVNSDNNIDGDIIEKILTDDIMDISMSDGVTETISVLTTSTRRNLLILLDMESFRITYPKEARLTPEYIKSELVRHKELLEFAKKYNLNQQIAAQESINTTSKMNDVVDFLPEGRKKTIVAISKFLARIYRIFSFESPNIDSQARELLVNQKIAITILERIIIEISEQKNYYNQKLNEKGDIELESLIKIMEEIIYQLNNSINSKNNNLKSDIEKYENLGLV